MMSIKLFVCAVLFMCLSLQAFGAEPETSPSAAHDIICVIESGILPLGIYFPGSQDTEHPVFNSTQVEHLLEVVPSKGVQVEAVKYGTSLRFRSNDMTTRVQVDFGYAPEETERPNILTFHNLADGDRNGAKPIELQHSGSGYIWINGREFVQHYTDVGHTFTIRNGKSQPLFSITLREYNPEL